MYSLLSRNSYGMRERCVHIEVLRVCAPKRDEVREETEKIT
jgi:hypothetical protein